MLHDRLGAGDSRPTEGRVELANDKSMFPPARDRLLGRLRFSEKGKVPT
jgi:hypothetical protein